MQYFPKSKSPNQFALQDSYLNIQLYSLYMLRFALNPFYLYEDMKDLLAMLHKFNFVRFFWQTNAENEYEARKCTERFIKSIKWRTHQSEEYLLLLIRMQSWQRFLITVEDLCLTYEAFQPA